MLVETMTEEGLPKVELAGGESLYIQVTPYPKVTDVDALDKWIKKQKLEDLYTVNYQTLKGITNDLLVNGKEPPPGVSAFIKSQARVRGIGKDE
jgi:hypothetical protein